MKRIDKDSGVRGERQRAFHRRLFARLGGSAAREGMVPVSDQTAEPGAGTETEPRAGYYVASQSRPAYVTNMTTEEIASVFDLVQKVSNFPKEPDAAKVETANGAHHPNGNGKRH
jgi:hypothetical protein